MLVETILSASLLVVTLATARNPESSSFPANRNPEVERALKSADAQRARLRMKLKRTSSKFRRYKSLSPEDVAAASCTAAARRRRLRKINCLKMRRKAAMKIAEYSRRHAHAKTRITRVSSATRT
mmetsp:Transcript_2982/g.4314  ORF Transcript_2982/g.4314 Transcript_2982/m.4314 type:complete len:125 (+) Transcript_2982:126-500(+)